LFLHNLVVNSALLVQKLLFALHLALINEEFSSFLAKIISCYKTVINDS
jgi:hypothetical protein